MWQWVKYRFVFVTDSDGEKGDNKDTEDEELDTDVESGMCSLVAYFRLFIVAIGCPSEQRPQKTISCYGG